MNSGAIITDGLLVHYPRASCRTDWEFRLETVMAT